MKNLVIKGIISTTSNKQSKEFKADKPLKTAYLKLSKAEAAKLEKFGVPKYTSVEKQEDFFCVKVVENVKMYLDKVSKDGIDMDASINTHNFKTADDIEIKMNIIQGEKAGNVFYRLQAVLLEDSGDIVAIEAENPFG